MGSAWLSREGSRKRLDNHSHPRQMAADGPRWTADFADGGGLGRRTWRWTIDKGVREPYLCRVVDERIESKRIRMRTSLFWICTAISLAGCASAQWPDLAARTAMATRTAPLPSGCEMVQLGDWGFRQQCGDSLIYLRCGYDGPAVCCWQVPTAAAATDVVARSGHVADGRMCDRRK